MTNKSWNTTLGVLLACSAGAAGCGGGSGGGSCGVSPCGGDIVANWTITEICLAPGAFMSMVPPALTAMCPAATVSPTVVDTTGSSMEFRSDMTFELQLALSGSAKLTIPASCLMGLTCAAVNALVAVELATNPIPNVQSISCAGAGDCICTIIAAPQSDMASGTYTTSGSTVTTTGSGTAATPEQNDYCVTGNTLVLRDMPVAMGGMMSDVTGLVGHK